MKKIIASLLVLILSMAIPAHADTTVVIPGFTEISYPSKVKIGSSGCKTIKFTYVNDENLVQENSVFLIQVLHKTKKITQGYGAWFSTLTANPISQEIGPLPGILLRQFGFLLRVFASGVSASPWRAASRSSWPCDAAPSRDAVQERRRRAVLRLRSNREHAVVLPGFLLFHFGFLLWNSCFTMVSVLEILEAGRCRQEHRRRAVLRLGSNREQ